MGFGVMSQNTLGIVSIVLVCATANAQPSANYIFGPLSCNAQLETEPWEFWSQTQLPQVSTTAAIEIPCGRNILMDLSGDIAFGGLIINGHLKFEDIGTDVHITTDHVLVHGFLTIGEEGAPLSNKVTFTLNGTEDVVADRSDCNGMCGIGRRAFAIMGGSVDLHGMPYSGSTVCPTWLELLDTVATYVQQPSNTNDPPIPSSCGDSGLVFQNAGIEDPSDTPQIPATCGSVFVNPSFEFPSTNPGIPSSPACGDGAVFLNPSFEDSPTSPTGWIATGGTLLVDATDASSGSNSLHLTGRAQSWHYVGQFLNASCLSSDVDYMLRAMVKLPPGAACEADGNGCPSVWVEPAELRLPVRFTETQLATSEFFVYITVPGTVDYWVDDLSISQPYSPPAAWEISGGFLDMVTDDTAFDGDSYMAISGRSSAWQNAGQYLDASCLTAGVEYDLSARVKLPPGAACFTDGAHCPVFMMRWVDSAGGGRFKWMGQINGATGTDGAWNLLLARAIFSAEELASSELYAYIDVPTTTDYWLDKVEITLPPSPPPHWNRLGGSLQVVTDPAGAYQGDQYLLLTERTATWQSVTHAFDPSCLASGVEYVMTVMVRLPSGAPCYSSGVSCPTMMLSYADANGQHVGRTLGRIEHGVDGAWNPMSVLVSFSEEELESTEHFSVHIGVGTTGDLMVDSAEILLQPQPAETDACMELIRNGDLEWHAHSWAPFRSNGGSLQLVNRGGIDDSAYLLNRERFGYWAGPGQNIDVGCLGTPGAVYEVTVSTMLPAGSRCTTQGTECPSVAARITVNGQDSYRTLGRQSGGVDGEWNTWSIQVMWTSEYTEADAVFLYVQGGDDSSDVGYDNFRVRRLELAANALVVADSASGCWTTGDEVAVTSSDIYLDHGERRTIVATHDMGHGRTRLTLDKPLEYTHDSGEFHSEVLLLSRGIVIEGVEHQPRIGGHLVVTHTAAVQTIEGVELRSMGQQGVLGKYPMHMHMCQNLAGSSISSMSIHDTFQRCVVVHGSDNVLVESNVAYETAGHCFFLEDGVEEGNVFRYNIGAATRRVDTVISSDETDNEPSTFWISNPNNTYVGNVAAGSESGGFWIELRESVRGPSRGLAKSVGMEPSRMMLKEFRSNRAHSNAIHGLHTYPGASYNPASHVNFQSFTTFRNQRAGIFFHNSRNMRVTRALCADNGWGIDVDRSQNVEILDSTIIGVSTGFEHSQYGLCPSSGMPLIGVDLHQQFPGSDLLGTRLSNVSFERLGDETGCAGSVAISSDDEMVGMWDPRTQVSGLTFDAATRKVHFPTYTVGANDAARQVTIHDIDGSIIGSPGYLVSRNQDIVSSSCVLNTDGNLYECPGACYRVQWLSTPSLAAWGMEDAVLEVTWTDGSVRKTFSLSGTSTEPGVDLPIDVHRRNYWVVLPAGSDVTARFVKDGATFQPLFIQIPADSDGYADTSPSCSGALSSFELMTPEAACGDIIRNGGLEDGTDTHFWARGILLGGWDVVHDPAQAASGQYYLRVPGTARTQDWMGPAQYLDTRCMVAGERSRFTAQVRPAEATDGPQVALRLKTLGREDEYVGVGQGAAVTSGWNLVEVEFEWTEEMAGAQAVLLHMAGMRGGVDVDYDDFSVTPVTTRGQPLLSADAPESGKEMGQRQQQARFPSLAVVLATVCGVGLLVLAAVFGTKRMAGSSASTASAKTTTIAELSFALNVAPGVKRQLEDTPDPAVVDAHPPQSPSRPPELALDVKERWRSGEQSRRSGNQRSSDDLAVTSPLARDRSGVWGPHTGDSVVTV